MRERSLANSSLPSFSSEPTREVVLGWSKNHIYFESSRLQKDGGSEGKNVSKNELKYISRDWRAALDSGSPNVTPRRVPFDRNLKVENSEKVLPPTFGGPASNGLKRLAKTFLNKILLCKLQCGTTFSCEIGQCNRPKRRSFAAKGKALPKKSIFPGDVVV